MPYKNKPVSKKKHVDHSQTNRNAIITAIILVVIIISAATTGLVIIQSSAATIAPQNKTLITQTTGQEKNRSKFFLKLYDYIARGQIELHSTLNKI